MSKTLMLCLLAVGCIGLTYLKSLRWSVPVVAALFVLVGCYNRAEDLQKLVAAHSTTEGYVVYVDCANHGSVYYGFRVNGQEYRERAPSGVFACATTKLGDRALVYYLPESPQTHSLFMPREAYARAKGWYIPELWWVVGMPVLVILFSIIIEVKRGRKKRAEG